MYAFDGTAGSKHEVARQLVDRLDDEDVGAASIQVLQELYVNLTRKLSPTVTPPNARTVVRDLFTWQIFRPTEDDVVQAIDYSIQWQTSFWDAMILAAANHIGCEVLWSEDLSHGQTYGSVTVRNPFT